MILRPVSEEERNRCYEFARILIVGGNQYNRFNQNQETQIIRTYVGKLAEYIFLHYLRSQEISYPERDMFEIFPGEMNVDQFDFEIGNGMTIDIKTASRSFHRRIMVPYDQYLAMRKDYYVGIKLYFTEVNGEIQPHSIVRSEIYGYATRETLDERPIENFGEGNCKAINLLALNDITALINQFREYGFR